MPSCLSACIWSVHFPSLISPVLMAVVMQNTLAKLSVCLYTNAFTGLLFPFNFTIPFFPSALKHQRHTCLLSLLVFTFLIIGSTTDHKRRTLR